MLIGCARRAPTNHAALVLCSLRTHLAWRRLSLVSTVAPSWVKRASCAPWKSALTQPRQLRREKTTRSSTKSSARRRQRAHSLAQKSAKKKRNRAPAPKYPAPAAACVPWRALRSCIYHSRSTRCWRLRAPFSSSKLLVTVHRGQR